MVCYSESSRSGEPCESGEQVTGDGSSESQ